MIYSLYQYKLSIENLHLFSRTLCDLGVVPICDEEFGGGARCRVGNSVAVFEVMYRGRHSALRVYLQPHHNLNAIYGKHLLSNELLVQSSPESYGLVDVVLCEWYEGETLQSRIEESLSKPAKLAHLSTMFEELALSLLGESWAHGDLKPENIIVTKEGLRLIDFDAMYREGFTVEDCVEIGTAQYQHPMRDRSTFGKSIDDYPIALITTVLAAMTLDASLGRALLRSDYFLINPHLAIEGRDDMLIRIERLFAEKGDARHLYIARMLRSKHQALPRLKSVLAMKPRLVSEADAAELSAECCNGYWGYTCRGEFVIPPYYDLAFDFSEGLGLVRLADVWHFIDSAGRVVITCGRGRGIKPFRGGVTRMQREDGVELKIYKDGRIEEIFTTSKINSVCIQKR